MRAAFGSSPVVYLGLLFWLVGTHKAKHGFRGSALPELSHLTHNVRDTENKLRWRVKLWQNESGKTSIREHDKQAYCALQQIARS